MIAHREHITRLPFGVVGNAGIEPANFCFAEPTLKLSQSIHVLYTNNLSIAANVERVERIELSTQPWQGRVLTVSTIPALY